MWPDRVSNQGPLTYESGARPTALCGPANVTVVKVSLSLSLSLCSLLSSPVTLSLSKVPV